MKTVLHHYDNGNVDDVMESKDEDEDQGALHGALQARKNCVFDAVENETTITLFLPPSFYELFYLCKILSMKIATKNIYDTYNHATGKDEKYL